MKFDLHCHTKSGSIDSRVSLERYIELLQQQGFHGMLVTDHDSYRGYRQWRNSVSSLQAGDFVVLEGIEYDTKDAGHFLVIMPDGVQLDLLRIRGMSVEQESDGRNLRGFPPAKGHRRYEACRLGGAHRGAISLAFQGQRREAGKI